MKKMASLCVISNSSEAVACSQDLITEILIRLPVNSLLRFKCVSKQWLSIISNPKFFTLHTSLASPRLILYRIPGLVINHLSPSSEKTFTSLNFINDSAGVKILQSINGLILCCSFPKLGKTRNFYICNPSTRKFFMLPAPNNANPNDLLPTTLGVYLSYDPSKTLHYQVVCVRNCPSSSSAYDTNQIHIYSSETHTWRISGFPPFVAPFDMMFENGVLWNGAIHWISPTGATLCFDIDQERVRSMPGPPSHESWGKRRFRYFGESGGHLHLVEIYGPSTTQFQIFEMERDYSRWIPRYQIDISAVVDAFPDIVRDYLDHHDDFRFYAFVLLFVQEIKQDSLLLLHIPGKFISYNVRDRKFKEICDFGPNCNKMNIASQIGCFNVFQFLETLASV